MRIFFLIFDTDIHMWCLLWVQSPIYHLPSRSQQWCMRFHLILARVLMPPIVLVLNIFLSIIQNDALWDMEQVHSGIFYLLFIVHNMHAINSSRCKLGHRWFGQWLATYSAPSHYLRQLLHIVNCNLMNRYKWYLNSKNTVILIHER